jgi:hypothetical protein
MAGGQRDLTAPAYLRQDNPQHSLVALLTWIGQICLWIYGSIGQIMPDFLASSSRSPPVHNRPRLGAARCVLALPFSFLGGK